MDLQFDREHIWHPYTSTLSPLPCFPVKSAEGVRIHLETGEVLIDGMSSWWSAIHGYRHPALDQAAHSQIDAMSHVMFGGLTHDPAISLCKNILSLAPKNMNHVFLADSGSVAVEVSLKMALQYWYAKHSQDTSQSIRSKFLTLEHGYHGDTFAAMSVTDPNNSMHKMYKGFLPEHIFAKSPECYQIQNGHWPEFNPDDILDFETKITEHQHEIAAVILEPIVQGAGGMRLYHPEFLVRVRQLCDQFGVLLILDEIATGFGRTGKLFACEHANIQPDILCVGKALTSGYMSLAATVTTKAVANMVCSSEAGCFMHGPTFMANPLACAIATASLNLIKQNHWQQQVASIEATFEQKLPMLRKYPLVKDVRWLGGIGVIETHVPVNMEVIQQHFVDQGVWIRPFGRLIYLMPPYISNQCDIIQLISAVESALNSPMCFIAN
ncbi:adenosylmethionine--8-amino-7-oxononanoate transaminase [Vibrio rumoiensis]|uniref:Adenosylmethionine-8-amino-7-oxononanoate aminotransferase n=1 Tax=Vibrio rumoiensis 1S-45 TaxID=1188252 RepID=A0A1E5E3I4_9VIBR|nr:adenosylmethionine--8-amino-7-oxononanoate transaminase [Vibrio rumoiensis]OEF26900.1 adenosylmethionine--8-amino-7-oxononanoate transaminase [Vibrio rumoiensis 1S-45]